MRFPVAETLLRLGVAAPPEDGVAWRVLARRAARALIKVSDENARREQGVYAVPAWTSAVPAVVVSCPSGPLCRPNGDADGADRDVPLRSAGPRGVGTPSGDGAALCVTGVSSIVGRRRRSAQPKGLQVVDEMA